MDRYYADSREYIDNTKPFDKRHIFDKLYKSDLLISITNNEIKIIKNRFNQQIDLDKILDVICNIVSDSIFPYKNENLSLFSDSIKLEMDSFLRELLLKYK